MRPKERIEAAFAHRSTDKVPVHHIGMSSRAASVVLGREVYVGGGIQRWREGTALWHGEAAHQEFVDRSFEDAIDLALAVGNDIVRPEYWRMARKPDQRLDEHTFRYRQGDEWYVMRFDPDTELYQEVERSPRPELAPDDLARQVAVAEEAAERYRPRPESYATTLRAQQRLGADWVVRVGGVGLGIPREPMWLEAIVARPDLVVRWLDAQAERAVRTVAFLAGHGFRYFWGGDDFASNQGPFYSPRAFRALVVPRLRRITEACHAHGGYHLFASDGNLWPVADDLFGTEAVDGFFEIDRRAGMDLGELRRRFPRLTLIGNIASSTVHQGTVEQVVAETRSCLEEAKRSGGIIVGCSNYLMPGTPVANILAMLDVIRKERC
ncbi:MAG: hypothetical protein HY332_09400 [Chloroflexi bacterium]|nr:hypothetical protein [Chloroflexota bacterium]